MGEMIEQIWIKKTSAGPRAEVSSFIRFGPDPQITIPASGFRQTASQGLTEDRTRSQTHALRNFLLFARQPQKKGQRSVAPRTKAGQMTATCFDQCRSRNPCKTGTVHK
jgi:hypothetical protein